MDKFLTRITIIIVAIYFLISYIVAQYFGIDILRCTYTLLFELCVVSYTFSSGKYHCRYMRWTALSIFCCDMLTYLDHHFDFIPISIYNYLLTGVLISGIATSTYKAIQHFIRIYKVNRQKNG